MGHLKMLKDMRFSLWAIAVAVLAFLALLPFGVMAQTPGSSPASSQETLKPQELEALVAPIALYPDTLLAEVLMAATYPLEVVQADRWLTANKNLKEDQSKAAVDKQPWDGSVKALVATPSVLTMMSSKLDWTQKLGDAFLAQQTEMMDAIQRLRAKAQANNHLASTDEQTVTVRQEQNRQVIAIEPTDPNTVYVPYYDPAVVYGAWPYADYPPYYFPDSYAGYIGPGLIATGIVFGAGYALSRWVSRGNYWGGGINWIRNTINVNRPVVNPLSGNVWQHNPAHRRGVRYNNVNVQQRFGNTNIAAGTRPRPDFRGSGGQQVLRPGSGVANRPSAGTLPSNRPIAGGRPSSGANRPSAGTLPSNRPVAGNRPSSGANSPSARNRPSSGANRPTARSRPAPQRMASRPSGGGGPRMGGGGRRAAGGFGGGGMRGGGGRGGGRRSDIALKHDIHLLGRLDNGLGFYRFSYSGSNKAYVGVIAQEVQAVMPSAVERGRDGYLQVFYHKLGVPFQTYNQWITSGAHVPAGSER
jgi:Protein of unknown function (DUF3300)/Chaperone of endosialidase